ncbi:hydroxyacid dehydrogenase (plasmid) [Natrinema zhouii]|uniref:hydroxyacid dehydrogenase n=1 Tax=Natrinema zhouii TaxID=1710539 RepID=UPI001CFFC15A|nr:hydroxyacid dehydrogenase [Natrinema zhouii]UHQ98859.1 hydroxyacid dehydrogenase [Natrinema zhouii]
MIESEKWQLLIPEQIASEGPESISDIVLSVETYDDETIGDQLPDADAIILRGVELDADLIADAERLKVISKHGVGLDSIDIDAASDRGIVVCNTPQANSRTVAEHAITLILTTRRNLLQADRAVRGGNWDARSDWDRFRRHTITGDTLGLFGFGSIAREAADLAVGMGMRCIVYDPYVSEDKLPADVEKASEKRALFEAADTVSVHAPLTDETRRAIGRDELREIDYIVNTARGEIIDESALERALAEDELIAAGLDVLHDEPPAPDDPLLQRDDVILSPHMGTLSVEATRRMSVGAAENVRTVYDGGVPESTVNKDAL